jgi:hypothetical protein
LGIVSWQGNESYHDERFYFKKAMAVYGAICRGIYDYSAIARDGSVVVSCWGQLLTDIGNKTLRYEVADLSQWTSNPSSRNQFKHHLEHAIQNDRRIRLIIAKEKETPAPKIEGTDGRKIQKVFFVEPDFIGRVIAIDGNRVVIDF